MTLLPVVADLLQDMPAKPIGLGGGGNSSVLIVLFLLLVGCSVAVWVFVKKGSFRGIKGGEHLQILETRALGGRQFLVVAKHNNSRFLLGVCPGRIDFLCPLEAAAVDEGPDSFETALKERTSKNESL